LVVHGEEVRLRPLLDRLVIRRTTAPEKIGSLFLPDTVKVREREPTGEVIAVGPGRNLSNGAVVPLVCKPGDFVLFGRLDGQEIKVDGEEQWIVREDEVLAVLHGDQVTPIGDVVVIAQDKQENAGYVGMIVIPDSAKQKDGRLAAEEVSTGVVVSTGPGRLIQQIRKDERVWKAETTPVLCRGGDRVIFRAYKTDYGQYARWKNLVLVHAFDVFGLLEKEVA
jgi:chaperonin GroES